MTLPRERSRSPRRSGSAEPKWKCNNCDTDNVGSLAKCSKCRLEKGMEKKEIYKEDWECPKCKSNNFSRRMDCYKCHARKPPRDPKHPDDWECMKCKGNNFSRRVDCFKCQEPKPHFLGHSYSDRGNEWSCGCGAKNFPGRNSCFKCHAPKSANHGSFNTLNSLPYHMPTTRSGYGVVVGGMGGGAGGMGGGAGGMGGGMPREVVGVAGGGAMSRMRSSSTERSHRPRSPIRSFQGALPERAPDVDPLTGEAEWICPLCGVDNFYKRFDCYRCHEKKPGDAVIGGEGASRGYSEPRDQGFVDNAYSAGKFSELPNNPYTNPPNNLYTNSPSNPYNTNPYANSPSNLQFQGGSTHLHHSNVRAEPGPKKRYSAEWICPGCQGLNFSKRVDCFKCHAAKPETGDSTQNFVPKENSNTGRPGDWTCPACSGNNFSRRVDCFKCKEPKPANLDVAC